MDSIRPLQNYDGGIVPQAVLNGTLGTVVYASNYNDLDNKPSINSVELRGNKTAEDLGLATPADITVTSVNTQTGDVSLTGQNIPYDNTYSVTEKINDLESQIVDSGVSSVNGHTGAVILTGSDINYSVGVSLNAKIDAVEGEIPVINYPVTSVNGETGAVVLTGSDIEYSEGVSINTQLDNVAEDISDLTGTTLPLTTNPADGTVSEAIGDLSTLTTTNNDSLVDAVNEVNANKADISLTSGTYSPQTNYTDMGSSIKKFGKLVVAHIKIQAPSAISTRTWVGAIGGTDFLPPMEIPFCGAGSATHNGFINRTITGYIGTNGGIMIGDNLTASTSAIDLYIDVAYFV